MESNILNSFSKRIFFSVHSETPESDKEMTSDLTVTVSEGKLEGCIKNDFNGEPFYSFQGIPYAKPPIGELRFKPPQPPDYWEGIRDATKEGNGCYSRLPNAVYAGSEDCLFLNVYTKQITGPDLKPVMVYIHGGGFKYGSSKTDVYGPDFLMTEDIVLVTFNYRLGALGFLYLEDSSLGVSGNAGLKDMVMALKWVKRNIREFCGDPTNITVFGESAGAASVHLLMLSPLSKGLFHKAIAQSGSALNMWVYGKKHGSQLLAETLNISTCNEAVLLNHLQDIPVDQLVKASDKIPDPFSCGKLRPFGFVVEKPSKDAFLSEHPLEIIKSGRYHKVPFILGCNSREGMFVYSLVSFVKNNYLLRNDTIVPHNLHIRPGSDKYEKVIKDVKEFYFGNKNPLDNNDDIHKLYTDNYFLLEVYKTALLHLATSSLPIYFYLFSLDTDLNFMKKIYDVKEVGACHADDIAYLFKTSFTPDIERGSKEIIGIQRMVKMWTNFARSGKPTPEETDLLKINWKPISKDEFNVLNINNNLELLKDHPERKALDFWMQIFETANLSNKL